MKKKNYKSYIALGMIAIMLTGCAEGVLTNEAGNVNKTNVGTVLGAAGGAVIGSNVGKGKGNIAAIAVGTLLGALAGREVGASLDRADIAYHNRAAQSALEFNRSGVASSWKNPDSGASGVVTPSRTYYDGSKYCREYTQTIKVGGKVQEAYGRACREPDGSWKIVE